MNLDIKNLNHFERDVAKHIKSTKKQFIWEFTLDGKLHKIELFDSRITGKKKVIKDGLILMQTEDEVAFIKTFDVGKHHCTLIQHGEKYELRIDNQSFNHLMDLERNKIYFTNNAPTSTSYIAKPLTRDEKKIGFGLSMAEIAKTKEKQQPLFNFSIKPVNESTVQPKRFNFSLKDKNNKEEFNSIVNNNVTSLIEIPDSIEDVTYQIPYKESKVNIMNLKNMEFIGGDNQNIYDKIPHANNKVFESKQVSGYGGSDMDISKNNNNTNKGNDLFNAIENLYKESGNSNK